VVKGEAKEITNSIGMKLVRIPSGTFTMGSTKEEQDEAIADFTKILGKKASDVQAAWVRSEAPRHEVEITKDFYLGIHEVTQAQYQTVIGKNPSWFCAHGWGKDKVKGLVTNNFPVESVSWDDAVVFCLKLSDLSAEKKAKGDNLTRTCKVGSCTKNRFGLYDMHGNVWEWCSDWYGADYYGKSPRRDPPGPSEGVYRVVRGGS
jgi:formylglycine-generating enzyme required for sulfatase activity